MSLENTSRTKFIRGVELRSDPARESCFQVVHLQTELQDYPDMSPVSRRQRLHRHMHNEMQNLEIAAQFIADFPDAPWELRLQVARQCWDETRHTQLVQRQLLRNGGTKGEFPVMNFEWGIVGMVDSVAGRLAIQNRTFEAGEMDLLRELVQKWKDVGDHDTAAVMEGILADEVQHVRFANQWLKRMARENPRILFQVASAIRFMKQATQNLIPKAGETNAVGVDIGSYVHMEVFANVEDRRLAEFTEEEINEIIRQEGLGSMIPASEPAAAR